MAGVFQRARRGALAAIMGAACLLAGTARADAIYDGETSALVNQGHAAFNEGVDLVGKAKAEYVAGRLAASCSLFQSAVGRMRDGYAFLRQADTRLDGDDGRQIVREATQVDDAIHDQVQNTKIACDAAAAAGQ
jgi:hypothetical protein